MNILEGNPWNYLQKAVLSFKLVDSFHTKVVFIVYSANNQRSSHVPA